MNNKCDQSKLVRSINTLVITPFPNLQYVSVSDWWIQPYFFTYKHCINYNKRQRKNMKRRESKQWPEIIAAVTLMILFCIEPYAWCYMTSFSLDFLLLCGKCSHVMYVFVRFISTCSSPQPLPRQPNSEAWRQYDHRDCDEHDDSAKWEQALPATVLSKSVPRERQHLWESDQRFAHQNSKQQRQDETGGSSICVHALWQVKDANHLRRHHGIQDISAEDPQKVNGVCGHGQGGRQQSRQ